MTCLRTQLVAGRARNQTKTQLAQQSVVLLENHAGVAPPGPAILVTSAAH